MKTTIQVIPYAVAIAQKVLEDVSIFIYYTLGCNILSMIAYLWGKTTLYTGGMGRAKIFVRRGHFSYVPDTNLADFQNFLIKWGLVTNSETEISTSYYFLTARCTR